MQRAGSEFVQRGQMGPGRVALVASEVIAGEFAVQYPHLTVAGDLG